MSTTRAQMKKWVKGLAPPMLLDLVRGRGGPGLRFEAHPKDWAEASAACSGYGADNILRRVIDATRAVASGHAAFERDSVLFDKPQWPLAAIVALLRAAALNAGHLHVLDFGGSLGSTYRQCRPFLQGLAAIDWWVVEQSNFAAAGATEFASEQLHFASSVAHVPAQPGGIVLACGVLQYLEDPYATLEQFAHRSARQLFIDRTSICDGEDDRLCIQHVPPSIYEAAYPCWLLSRPKLMRALESHWRLVAEFDCAEGRLDTTDGFSFEFLGMLFERKV